MMNKQKMKLPKYAMSREKLTVQNTVKGGNFKNQIFLEHPNKHFGPSCFVRALDLVHLIPSWLVLSGQKIERTVHASLNQFKPVQQRRQQALRA